jgi:hypothetical protein
MNIVPCTLHALDTGRLPPDGTLRGGGVRAGGRMFTKVAKESEIRERKGKRNMGTGG